MTHNEDYFSNIESFSPIAELTYLFRVQLKNIEFKQRPVFAYGKGHTENEAYTSCIGEAVERLALLSKVKSEIIIGQSFNGEQIEFKSSEIFIRSNESIANSNGAASGLDRTDALVRGLLEIFERDIVMIWWYNQLRGIAINLETIQNFNLQLKFKYFKNNSKKFQILQIPNDLGVYCFISIIKKDEDLFVFGFGCHIHSLQALNASILELEQNLFFQNIIIEKSFKIIDSSREYFPIQSMLQTDDNFEILDYLINSLNRLNITAGFVDISLPQFSIKTVKVICHELNGINKNLKNKRLNNVPKEFHISEIRKSNINFERTCILGK